MTFIFPSLRNIYLPFFFFNKKYSIISIFFIFTSNEMTFYILLANELISAFFSKKNMTISVFWLSFLHEQ